MKKLVTLLLILSMCVSLAACGDKDGQKEEDQAGEEEKEQDADSGDAGENEKKSDSGEMYTLTTEDGEVSIQVRNPEGFEAAEYASDTWLCFECPGSTEGASTQYAMSLFEQEAAEVAETMRQEVEYLLSANSEDEVQSPEVQTVEAGGRQWSYFSYGMEELEGYRVWTALENGCIFACTAENVGADLESLDIESIVAELAGLIQE